MTKYYVDYSDGGKEEFTHDQIMQRLDLCMYVSLMVSEEISRLEVDYIDMTKIVIRALNIV